MAAAPAMNTIAPTTNGPDTPATPTTTAAEAGPTMPAA
jgi:hypothetical protein